jgi:hypothetical protein
MGTSRSVDEFVGKIQKIPTAMNGQQTIRVAKAGRDITVRCLEQELHQVTSSGVLRNVGKKGAKLKVRSQQVNQNGTKIGEFVVSASGPWQFIENDRRAPYGIGSRRGGGSRRSRGDAILAGTYKVKGTKKRSRGSKMVATPFGPRPFVIIRTKLKGRHPWAKGRARAEKTAPKAMSAAIQSEIAKVLK